MRLDVCVCGNCGRMFATATDDQDRQYCSLVCRHQATGDVMADPYRQTERDARQEEGRE